MPSVLLVAHTRLSLSYVLDQYGLLADDPRITWAITRAPDEYSAGVEPIIELTGLPRLPYVAAVRRRWDAALFGTHGSEVHFTGAARRIHIQHGVGAGKLIFGQDFTYGPRWALWEGRPKFHLMLEASHEVRQRAVAGCPQLEEVIAVVGDLRADRLLAAEARRHAHRARLGIGVGELAVLFVSTFGPHGLLGSTGLTLIDEALRLGAPYRPLLTAHPHAWTGRQDHRRRLTTALAPRVGAGLVVCGPYDDWAPYLAAADLAVVDHSSLGLYYAMLGRPLATIPVPTRLVNPVAPLTTLRAAAPLVDRPSRLATALALAPVMHAARHGRAAFAVTRYQRAVTSYPGQAATRTRTLLYRALGLNERWRSASSSPVSQPSSPAAAPTR